MQFHRSTIAAFAATFFLTFFAAEGSGANAENRETQQVAAPALTDETVPVAPPVTMISEAVVQAIPADQPAQAASAAPHAESLQELVAAMPHSEVLSEEMQCLAGAIYFEARGEPLLGQLAVGEVIINRSGSGAFPSSYCGVVYQRSQFSFVRGGKMPAINRQSAAWKRATAIARIAHEDLWDSHADRALFFHARSVKPGWSRSKIALATIDSHIFYR